MGNQGEIQKELAMNWKVNSGIISYPTGKASYEKSFIYIYTHTHFHNGHCEVEENRFKNQETM